MKLVSRLKLINKYVYAYADYRDDFMNGMEILCTNGKVESNYE